MFVVFRHREAPYAAAGGITRDDGGSPPFRHPERRRGGVAGSTESKDLVPKRMHVKHLRGVGRRELRFAPQPAKTSGAGNAASPALSVTGVCGVSSSRGRVPSSHDRYLQKARMPEITIREEPAPSPGRPNRIHRVIVLRWDYACQEMGPPCARPRYPQPDGAGRAEDSICNPKSAIRGVSRTGDVRPILVRWRLRPGNRRTHSRSGCTGRRARGGASRFSSA